MKQIKKSLLLSLVLGSIALSSCGGGGGTKYTVTFDLNGGEGEIAPVQVKEGGKVKEPTAPTKTDAVKGEIKFAGWYNGDTIWSFKLSTVKKDITLTARWLEKYTVRFDGVSDPALATQYIDRGSQITKPADPTQAGKVFYGWKNKTNGGQIWDFTNERLGKVMMDCEFEPFFVDAGAEAQYLEAELCPNILDMEGSTYSGGSQGRGLIGSDSQHALGAHGDYIRPNGRDAEYATASSDQTKVFGGYVHHMYNRGNHLDWNFTSDVAATNVTMLMRLSAEYSKDSGHPDGENILSFDDNSFLVKVNNERIQYGSVTMHNVGKTGTNDFLPFQDFFLSVSVSLNAGANKIEMIADNSDFDTGTLVAVCPVIDCVKLYTSATLTWAEADISCMDKA